MESESSGNHLQDVLSESEISEVPFRVANKINVYIDKKFQEYLTSTSLLEDNKSQVGDKKATLESTLLETTAKYEDAAKKLSTADATISDLEKQVETLKAELESGHKKNCLLKNEIISMKSARDAAVDERNDLTSIVERRNTEIERLKASVISFSEQLQAAVETKCEALQSINNIQSQELALQYRAKRIEQERTLLNSQISGLTDTVNRLTSELQTVKSNNTSRIIKLETQLAEKLEELNAANETIGQLNEVKKNLNSRAENLTQHLMEQREIEIKMTDNYKKELDAKTKLAELFKTMYDDTNAKTYKLTEGIRKLQKLLNEATEKYGELEIENKQIELYHEELIKKKNEMISSLKSELEHANDLLKAANSHNLDMKPCDLAPSAATESKLITCMTLTQIYSKLVKATEELAQEKDENRLLKITINAIVQELEGKIPMLQKQEVELGEAIERNTALSQQIDSLVIESTRLKETSKIANHYKQENSKLKGELADLGKQVCFLLKEVEHSREGFLPNDNHDSNHTAANTSDSSRMISESLVTFSDIQGLQTNNQTLLCMVRELTEKVGDLDRNNESSEMQAKNETLKNRVSELTEAQDRQIKMINGLIRQRDMFKKLYSEQMNGKRHEVSVAEASVIDKSGSFKIDTSADTVSKSGPTEPTILEIKYRETEKLLELLKEEYKSYKEEKVASEKMWFEQNVSLRQKNSQLSFTSEKNHEILNVLQTEIATYKKQITSLKEKNKAYNATIAKHEVSIQYLKDKTLNAQSKLAAAEIQLENLKLECKFVKDAELRLQTEIEMLNRERQGQSLLLKKLELIKASVERVETENRAKLETRLDEATRECSALRRRLQEEQDRFREVASRFERQTETAKTRMQEEKDAADVLRKELAELRQDLAAKNKAHEDLTKKLKAALAPNTDGSLDTVNKIKELENKLTDKNCEVDALQNQLNVAKEHIKQYCDVSENAENEVKILNTEYKTYKTETEAKLTNYANKLQHLKDRCAELEAELSLHPNGEHSASNMLRNELQAKLDEEKANYEKLQQENEALRTANKDIKEKSKRVLKEAKSRLMQLTEINKTLSRKRDETRSKIGVIEQSTCDQQDVRLALIKSQYVGRLNRLEKKRDEAQAENLPAEKTTSDPPTANIKPMTGVAQQSTVDTPLASIRPMAQVGPTAPHDVHSTEYMPASSSRPLPRAAVTAALPPESTQAFVMVMPRIEQPSAAAGGPKPPAPVPPQPGTATPTATTSAQPSGSGSTSHAPTGVSTSHPPPEARPGKRRRRPRSFTANKRTRGFEPYVEMEDQGATSRCDDEGVIVVDSEKDDERCSGTMYRERDEEMKEEREVEAGEEKEVEGEEGANSTRPESPAQTPVANKSAEEGSQATSLEARGSNPTASQSQRRGRPCRR